MDDCSAWTYRNEGGRSVTVVLEPHGDEVTVAPGSTLVIEARGGTASAGGEPRLSAVALDDVVTVQAHWSGSVVTAALDGIRT